MTPSEHPNDGVRMVLGLGANHFLMTTCARARRIWYRGEEMLTGRTDEEKFTEGVNFLPFDEDRREQIKHWISNVQRFMPLLPENGLVVFYSDEDVSSIMPLLERHAANVELIDKDKGFSLWRMHVNQ